MWPEERIVSPHTRHVYSFLGVFDSFCSDVDASTFKNSNRKPVLLLLRKKKPVLPEKEDSAAAAKAAAFFCLQTVVLDGGLTTADVEGVVAEEEGSPICDITVDDSVEADDEEPDCTEEAVVFEPLFLTFA